MINLENLVLIGPGSEWFWTAVSGVVLAITFLAIYRQLALARSASAFEQMDRLNKDWASELADRNKLAILEAIADGTPLDQLPSGATAYIGGFWENTAALVRAGHVDARAVHDDFGPAIRYWHAILAPSTARYRADMQVRVMEHFDWLHERMKELDRRENRPFNIDADYIASTLAARIAVLRDSVARSESLRTVIIRDADAPASRRRHR